MKLSKKINIFLFAILVSVVLVMVGVGALVINSIVYELNQRLLSNELDKIEQTIEEDYAVLQKHGLTDVPAYVKNARQELIRLFDHKKNADGAMVMLIAENGNDASLQKTALDPQTLKRLRQGGKGALSYAVNGVKYFGVYDSFKPWGWIILVSLDEKTLFVKRDEYIRTVSVMALAVIMIALVIGFRFGAGLSRRIERTLAVVQRIRQGDLSSRIEDVSHDDEIGGLQDGINSMASTLLQRTEDQKKTQLALLQSEQYIRMLFEQSPIGLALSDMDGKLVDVNPAYARIIGYSVRQAKKLTYWDVTPKKYMQQEKKQLENLKKTGRYGPFEKEYICKSGERVWVRLSGRIIERQGKPYIWSSVEDISAQKAAEKSRARLMSILESTPDFVAMAGRNDKLLYLNKSARRLFGIELSADISNRSLTDFMSPQSVRFIYETALPYAMTHDSWLGETELLKPDGSVAPMLQALIVHKSEDGELEYISTIAKDISEIRQARQALIDHRDHLEELVYARTQQLETVNKELESFSYSVSHDLRTPLRGIDGFSHALLEDYDHVLDETGKDYLRRVRRAAQQMGGIIDTMLELSRVNRHEVQLQTVQLGEMAHEILQRFQQMEPQRKVDCRVAQAIQVEGDEHLLRIVLENLLGNAWKYTAKTAHARIEFDCLQQDGETVYFVKDNGAGFNMKYADKLFGSFQRLHGAEFDGRGIGLATVQRCIRRLGGRVWGQGEEGKGASFFFTLTGRT